MYFKNSYYFYNNCQKANPACATQISQKLKSYVIITVVLCLTSAKISAQSHVVSNDTSQPRHIKEFKQNLNWVKQGLTDHSLNNYSVQYERSISRKISLSLNLKIMPGTTMPIRNLIVSTAGQDDKNMVKTIENLRIRHSAITPEIRFYLGKKGYGRGFYIAPFYRQACFKTNELKVHFGESKHDGTSIKLAGKLITHTTGLMLGAQWIVKKRLCLNWWVLGPHYGMGNGNFSGVSSKILTVVQQQNIRKELTNLDIPLTQKSINVYNKGASLQLNGLWAGVRGGFCIRLKY